MRDVLIAMVLPILIASSALAGDEVDYSAPYITLENGELVTKYPAKEHVLGEDRAQVSVQSGTEPAPPASPPQWPIIAVAAIVVAAVLLLLQRRRRPTTGQDVHD